MYPVISFPGFFISQIYLFGVCMVIAWILFFYGLHRRAIVSGITKHIFRYVTTFTFVIFIGSRLMYVFSQWRTEKFIFQDFLSGSDKFSIFLGKFLFSSGTGEYNLSFAGGVIGFLLVFFWLTKSQKKQRIQYFDIIIPAFFIAAIVGYFGAFLGGQIYGVPFESFISLEYKHKYNIVPLQKPLFPLPIFYMIIAIIGAAGSYILSKKILPKGFIGAAGLGFFSVMLFLFEFLNGADDTLSSHFFFNINQFLSIFGILFAFGVFLKIIRE
ncbi:prolipoprotein diacylglyceryl transferase [Candidatus Gracilibacteria bacterium]|nr:prolipoprotein diacylglyceryl transferase [Candidatus Gracilibacteria bacterium]